VGSPLVAGCLELAGGARHLYSSRINNFWHIKKE
jgi:hypothetical protein